MLVLMRRVGDSIILEQGERMIEVRILDIQRSRVKLGINAPPDVSIVRAEVQHEHAGNEPRASA